MWPFTKKKDPRYNHVLTDDDRQHALDVRAAKLEILKAEKELKLLEIERQKTEIQLDIQEMSGEEDQDPMEAMLMSLVMPQIKNIIPAGQIPVTSSMSAILQDEHPPDPAGVNLTDEQLAILWNRIPNGIKKQAKKMNDEELRTWIISSVPNISKESVGKALNFVHSH